MKKKESIRAISSTLLALASSVLTNLVYGELSNTRYVVRIVDEITTLEQVNELSFGMRLLAIGIVFFSVWALLFVVRWCFPWFIRRVTYRNKQNYTKRDVYSNYISAKSVLVKVMQITKTEPQIAIFYSKEIEGAVTLLFNTFCPQKKRLDRVVKGTFRTGAANDFEQRISPYEYLAVIRIADTLLNALKNSSEDGMLRNDCQVLSGQLNQLRSIGEIT